MKEVRKIVVPVDFSQHTAKIAEYALYVAKCFAANVSFVHVAEGYGGRYAGIAHPSIEDVENELRQQAEKKMEHLLTDNSSESVKCTGKVLVGDVEDGIIEYATDEKADLLVIGTHGAKGLEKILLGSVTERVVKKAPCPVLTFNPYQ
jgi:nucleotide-binding universal stress UspA family protein